jgi:secreted trypsin-like serine protease
MRVLKSFAQFGLVLGVSLSSYAFAADFDALLMGGTVADPADWPASPWLGNCSATLIGEKVLLTAAHCVSNGGSTSFSVSGTKYTGKCTHHSNYRSNQTADWALCALNAPVPNIEFEVIATEEDVHCSTGQEFLWTGYGCQRWNGGLDGKFRVGTVKSVSCPRGTNHDVITTGKVALCSGDSGGGGYVQLGNTRRVVGVNSRSNRTDTSYVSNVFSSTFRTWAESWANSKSIEICGIHPSAKNCAP